MAKFMNKAFSYNIADDVKRVLGKDD